MVKSRFSSLIQVLSHRAQQNPDQPAFTFDDTKFTYQQIWNTLNRFGALLLQKKLNPGDRVVLTLPNGSEFFTAFYGTQRAGGIPVPIFPASGVDRVLNISRLCEARVIVIPTSLPKSQAEEMNILAKDHGRLVMSVEEGRPPTVISNLPYPQPEDIAFIQYTSGSTGDPKGVQLSHADLLINMEQMIQGMEITQKDIFVSWLPLYHDMGLILMTMVPFYLGIKLFLLPTTLVGMRKWIEIIHKFKGTFTAAPDFAYRTVLAYLRKIEKFDLSSLRVALNAAEPVRAKTITDFESKFGLKNVMSPAYGLAEATVGVSMWPPQTPIKVGKRGFVSVGKGFPEVKMKILHEGKIAGPGIIGEILVKSPANTRGYLGNPKATSLLYWRNNYIRTGDMGYYDDERDFFIVGRRKNIIIHTGQNISPQEVEETVDSLPFVRLSAAVGIDRGGIEGEQVYIFAETRVKPSASQAELQDLAVKIVQSFYSHLGFRPGRVYLLKLRSIPRTDSGKTRYSYLKEKYLKGDLQKEGLILFPDY